MGNKNRGPRAGMAALLGAPYRPPKLRRGDRSTCLYRDGDVVITGWSAGRIPWPRCRRAGARGGSGLLVDTELLRAIRTESSLALQHWFGVSEYNVWCWRKAFGVRKWGPEGSRRLHARLSEAGAGKARGQPRPPEQVRRTVATRKVQGYVLPNRWAEGGWTADQLALLGTLPDAEVAARIGRTSGAVRRKRGLLGIVNPFDGRRRVDRVAKR